MEKMMIAPEKKPVFASEKKARKYAKTVVPAEDHDCIMVSSSVNSEGEIVYSYFVSAFYAFED